MTGPTPESMQREREQGSDQHLQITSSGPTVQCRTRAEAETWAAEWWTKYEASAEKHNASLYFEAQPLFDLLEPLADGTPAPVRLVKGSWMLARAKRLRRSRTDEERTKLKLPRRQEMPEEAFLTSAEVNALPRGHIGDAGETCGLDGNDCLILCVFQGAVWRPWQWPNALNKCRRLTQAKRAGKPIKLVSISQCVTSDRTQRLRDSYFMLSLTCARSLG